MSITISSPPPEISTLTTPSQPTQTQDVANPPLLANAKPKKFTMSKFQDCFSSNPQMMQPNSVNPNITTPITTTTTAGSTHDEKLSNLVQQDLNEIKEASDKLKNFKDRVDVQASEAIAEFEKIKEVASGSGGSSDELRDLKKKVTKLKLQITSTHKIQSQKKDPHRNLRPNGFGKTKKVLADKVLDEMPQLYKNPTFENSLAFQDFQTNYNKLIPELKLCLLCFAVFPENVTIKKRVMVYWWIGECFVPPRGALQEIAEGKTPEDFANRFFHNLMEMGFIEPVDKIGNPIKVSSMVDSCKMHPFTRSAVIALAARANFFDFDNKGNPTEEFANSFRACLAGKGLINLQNLDKLHMLFNVNEAILEFRQEWFLKMKNVNVLYLGRWQTAATHHIEVEDTKFLSGLENMNHLRFFSLQGVSRVTELPDSISQLTSLMILDMRACHNLEVIPEGIGLLKNLTHLDMSECYLIDNMPKGLAFLSALEVLKGFIVGDFNSKSSCTLDDLAKLPRLRKLSIYTGVTDFPRDLQLAALKRFPELRKLTVAWGRGSFLEKSDIAKTGNSGQDKNAGQPATPPAKKPHATGALTRAMPVNPEIAAQSVVALLPLQLEKLDLQCFPEKFAPDWLKPRNLRSLKKLYVRGGKLCDLGQFMEFDDDGGTNSMPKKDTWVVETLCLKYLRELEIDWSELQGLFPKLMYLKKVKCPKLTFFPCDESGVWDIKVAARK